MNRTTLLAVVALVGSTGCRYDEGLVVENLTGTVKIPVAAGTQTVVRADGSTEELTDSKLIGPVFLGLYSGVDPINVQEAYPYPTRGPQFRGDEPGDTYPYGGTTVGDFRFPCFEDLVCKTVSNRFLDFDDLVDWFNNALGDSITDAAGQPVETGDYMRQTCYDLLDAANDEEVRLTATDRNDDGAVNELDLDFVLDDSGEFFVADFEILQQEHFYDQSAENCEPGIDCPGYTLWGFMDTPNYAAADDSGVAGEGVASYFSTCDPSAQNSLDIREYNVEFQGGAFFRDILNQPSKRIDGGDWVASEGYRWDNVYEQPELLIDFEVF